MLQQHQRGGFVAGREQQVKSPSPNHLNPFLHSFFYALRLADHDDGQIRIERPQTLHRLAPGAAVEAPVGKDRFELAACELLQALGLRSFSPSVTACPGCGRTTSSTFQELAERTQDYVRERMPEWKTRYEGVETMTLAVMGCIVNGPGESKAANIGISLPGTGESPNCPVYIDGKHTTTLRGTYEELAVAFRELVDDYIDTKYARKSREPRA